MNLKETTQTNKINVNDNEEKINNIKEQINNITGEDLKNVLCDRIFKSLILFLYYNDDKYRDFLEETIDTYMKFMIEYEGEIYTKNSKRFPVELNKKIKLWIYYPDEDDQDKILYHIRGKIIFSELNQPRIYGLITNDNPLRIYPTEDWLELAESIMDHDDITNEIEKKKLGREGWRSKFSKKNLKINQEEKKQEEKNRSDDSCKMDESNKNNDLCKTDSSEIPNIITKDKISMMKLKELKSEAKKVGLNIYGKKGEIQQKLIEYYKLN
jgi:hypothetical protein